MHTAATSKTSLETAISILPPPLAQPAKQSAAQLRSAIPAHGGQCSDNYHAGQWNEDQNRNRGGDTAQYGQNSSYSPHKRKEPKGYHRSDDLIREMSATA